jgi:stage V sporulation protein B
MVSYIFFRIGGLIYRFLMSRLLGPDGYGLVVLTLPFQGIFQILSAAGIPPAVAKFVAQHKAVGEDEMARQVIFTSLKIMSILGIFFALVMFFSADWIALNWFHKPAVAYPLKAVALITPFSVIVGAFRGSFQGLYRMEFIVATRAVEQIFTIIFAVVLVSLGFYAAGAVLGTGLGFAASAVTAVIIYRKYLWKYFPTPDPEKKLSFKEELGLARIILTFSIPVAITGLSELAIYDVSTFMIGRYMTEKDAGYYGTADPIARLPLIISLSVAAAILPAASEAASLNDKKLLETYVNQSYRYVILTVLPICVGVSIFAEPILGLIFTYEYVYGAGALSILVVGMAFYTLFMVSSSIAQGIGHPRLPMFILLIGTGLNIALNYVMVQYYGLIGAAAATTIAAFIIMVAIVWRTFQITEIKPPYLDFVKIGIASLVMGLIIFIIPKSISGLIAAIIIAPIIYIIAFTLIGGIKKDDIRIMKKYLVKFGPLSKLLEKLVKFIERFAK